MYDRKNTILGVLIATGAILAPLAGCKSGQAGTKPEEERGKPVRVEEVALGTVEDVLVYSVDLEPEAEVKVYSMLTETIEDFPWENGDEVEKGQRIALIRKKGLTKNVAQMAAQVEGLDVQIANMEDQLERTRKLVAQGVMSETELENMEASYKALKAQKKATIAGKGQILDTVGKATVKAPLDGIIADVAYEPGDLANPAIPLCRILAVDRLVAKLDLVEEDVPKVNLGQEVHIRMDAYPDRTFRGEITRILPYLNEATRTNTIEVTIDNPVDEAAGQRLLKPGMYGKAEIVVERHPDVVVAPEYALLMDDMLLEKQKQEGKLLRKAFVVSGDVARERTIELGIRQGGLFEVLSGLEGGEKIVVRGQHGLEDGQIVEIVEKDR